MVDIHIYYIGKDRLDLKSKRATILILIDRVSIINRIWKVFPTRYTYHNTNRKKIAGCYTTFFAITQIP